ncbi:MAG: HlyD family efflux transporter periplasmic adaptor subunit [Myxococcales bacterium]|nr:HlyD family efflux transporter periplasmic adaptor subunit [Myxococcales bacterium]
MSLPQRHLVRRSAASASQAAAARAPEARRPTYDPGDFGESDDTDPSVAGWGAHGHDDPPTTRPSTQVARPQPRRQAAGTPVPDAVEAPTRLARRATSAPWQSAEGATPSLRRASPPSALPPPPVRARALPLPRQASVVTPLPRQASVVSPPPRPASVMAPLPRASVVAPRPRAPEAPPAPGPATAAPAQLDLPAELAAPVYGLVRRLALQSELVAADRVLRVGVAELTDATVAMSRFIGDDGQPWALEDQGDGGPGDAILAQIAAAGCQACQGHLLVQPIVAAGRTVALLILTRTERLAGFGLVERAIAMLVARECAGLVHQLLGAHAVKAREAVADARSLFRPEALERHRSRGSEGALINLSPAWIRRAYPLACALVVAALAFAAFARVPTYSTGPVVITVDGHDVTAPAQGTVDQIAVAANDRVVKGQELARLYSMQEQAELEQAEQERSNALTTFLLDSDDSAKQTLAAASAKRERARAVVDARTVRASSDGVVSDVRVRAGQNLMPGDRILTIVPEGADPVVVALLPGQDRPRLRVGQTLQVELKGFIKPRERVVITEVGAEVLGPDDARRTLGAQFADLVGNSGAYVLVKARLPRRTFEAQHHTYHFHNGLRGTAEVRIESKAFLATLLPAIEKILY